MNVFGRKWKIYIVNPRIEGVLIGADPTSNSTIYDTRLVTDEALLLESPLHMTATVKYSNSGENGDDNAQIEVYNLSRDTVNRIKANNTLLLYAGYEQDSQLPLLFVGTIQKCNTRKDGADRVTTFTCLEGGLVRKTLHFNRTYYVGMYTYMQILKDITDVLKEAGIPHVLNNTPTEQADRQTLPLYTELTGIPQLPAPYRADLERRLQVTIPYSYALQGRLFNSLTKVCKDIDFVWFVSKGVLYIQPREFPVLQDLVSVIPNNIIGGVEPYSSNIGMTGEVSDEGNGVDLTVFLDARIGLESYIKLSHGEYVGMYTPDIIEHKMDYHSGVWQTNIKTKPYITGSLTIPQTLEGFQ